MRVNFVKDRVTGKLVLKDKSNFKPIEEATVAYETVAVAFCKLGGAYVKVLALLVVSWLLFAGLLLFS